MAAPLSLAASIATSTYGRPRPASCGWLSKPDTSPPARGPEVLTAEQLESLWKALEADDATSADDAVLTLSARPKETVAFLQSQLKPSDTKVDSKQIEKRIKELDDENSSTRENAQAELQKLGRTVLVPVQAALSKSNSVEMKRGLEEILKALDKNELPTRRPAGNAGAGGAGTGQHPGVTETAENAGRRHSAGGTDHQGKGRPGATGQTAKMSRNWL